MVVVITQTASGRGGKSRRKRQLERRGRVGLGGEYEV